jgi:hypothetical protein
VTAHEIFTASEISAKANYIRIGGLAIADEGVECCGYLEEHEFLCSASAPYNLVG